MRKAFEKQPNLQLTYTPAPDGSSKEQFISPLVWEVTEIFIQA